MTVASLRISEEEDAATPAGLLDDRTGGAMAKLALLFSTREDPSELAVWSGNGDI
jgi:hypothetical protein